MEQGNAEFNDIVFQEGKDGERHQKKYEALLKRDINPIRYVNDSFLRSLGLYDIVYWMLDRLNLTHFVHEEILLLLG